MPHPSSPDGFGFSTNGLELGLELGLVLFHHFHLIKEKIIIKKNKKTFENKKKIWNQVWKRGMEGDLEICIELNNNKKQKRKVNK